MGGCEIRALTGADWELFRRVRLAALQEAPYAFGSRYEDWVDAPEERWRDRLTRVPFTVVAELGGDPVGMACGMEDGDSVQMISVWVAPEARGRGVAQHLFRAVTDWAAGLGRTTRLMVRDDNPAAIAAYRAFGFIDRGIPDGQDPHEPPERLMVHTARAR